MIDRSGNEFTGGSLSEFLADLKDCAMGRGPATEILERYVDERIRWIRNVNCEFFIPSASLADENLGRWLSASLEDPQSCPEFRADVEAWFESRMFEFAEKPADPLAEGTSEA